VFRYFLSLTIAFSALGNPWVDPLTAEQWWVQSGLAARLPAEKVCETQGWRLPSRLVSPKSLNRFFRSEIGQGLPLVSYRLGGKIGGHVYQARVFWMQDYDYNSVYGDIWFVGAQVEGVEEGYAQPHVRDSVSPFSVVCYRRAAPID
jgi:hypothetical protein